MYEPDIAPLARRLAEENNVDWRRLTGTGDGGRIVERDVLTYLARVMAGEEDLDPTPEPVPEGMQAWPEDDVAAYRADAPGGRSVTDTLDEDLFLFDDGAAPVAASPKSPAGAEPAPFDADAPAAPTDDEGLLLVDEPAPAAPYPHGTPAPFEPDDLAAAPAARGDALPDLFGAGIEGDADGEGVIFLDAPEAPTDAADVHEFDATDVGAFVPERATGPASVPSPAGEAEAAAAAVSPGAMPRGAVDLQVAVVRHGQLWRRRVDDRAFRAAVSQVADALDVAPSAVAETLLGRAAASAWGMRRVDAWRLAGEGAQQRPLPLEGPIAEGVRALERGGFVDAGGAPDLIVADLAALALDEAVLHLGSPVLALGRSVGGDGAWLTLSGDEVPRDAVLTLAQVGELLASPYRLLL